jgi:hypothetical protein
MDSIIEIFFFSKKKGHFAEIKDGEKILLDDYSEKLMSL